MRKPAAAERDTTLLIGYGNTLRGDDAAGPAVAEQVAQRQWTGVQALAVPQLFPELAEDIARAARVVFVDASTAPGDGPALVPLREATDDMMAHRCSPGALLRMARELYGARPQAHVLAIPAEQFETGAALSPSVTRHIHQALALLRDRIGPHA
jgi:hydrogenase maturation protease